ncbi:MAG: hypothetical protein JNM01_20360 [Delftia acidovorans]|nr:hypothetical protein [Delftia acidovorans]
MLFAALARAAVLRSFPATLRPTTVPAERQPSAASSSVSSFPDDLLCLPRSPALRALLALAVLAGCGLAFTAYLNPNLVFDLANLAFCG